MENIINYFKLALETHNSKALVNGGVHTSMDVVFFRMSFRSIRSKSWSMIILVVI